MSRVTSADENNSFTWHCCWPWLLIFSLTFVAYVPIVRAGFIWDDDKHVTENRLLQSPDGLQTLWTVRDALPQYYPLTHTCFWVEQHLWGNHPLGYHLINVFLHACNAALIWRLLRRLNVPGALLAALLFAVHPVNVETAAWVSERKNTLSSFFYLLSLSCWLRLPPVDPKRRWRWQWYAAAFLFFICALLSKTVTSTLPAAVLLVVWFRTGRIRWRDVWPLIPFFILGIIAGANTAWLERTHVGASGPEWRFATTLPGEAVARVLIAGRVLCFYFSKLIVPYPLMFEYPRWHIDVTTGWQYLLPLLVLSVLVGLWKWRDRVGRGPLSAMLFFAGTLFPALGVNNIYPMLFSFVADHFQYLATIGPLALLAAGLHRLILRDRRFAIVPVAIVSTLTVLTLVRVNLFRSEEVLYTDSVKKNPDGWMTQSNLGALLIADGKIDEAANHLQIALRLHPKNAVSAIRMGQIALQQNDLDAAIDWGHRAAAMEPRMGESHVLIGHALENMGDTVGAIAEYSLAVQLQPNDAPARVEFGVLLAKHQRYSDAVVQFDQALRIDPRSKTARLDRLASLERAGYFDRAADELHAMIPIETDAKRLPVLWSDLGIVENFRHHPQQAIDAFGESLRLNPSQPETQRRLDTLIQSMRVNSP